MGLPAAPRASRWEEARASTGALGSKTPTASPSAPITAAAPSGRAPVDGRSRRPAAPGALPAEVDTEPEDHGPRERRGLKPAVAEDEVLRRPLAVRLEQQRPAQDEEHERD